MEDLNIERTDQSLEVRFDNTGELLISGISTPDNVTNFYTPLFNWLKEFSKTNPERIKLEMFIDYLNTSSTRVIIEFLIMFSELKSKGTELNIIWKYEEDDEDMLELGEEISLVSKLDMTFESVED